MMTSNERKCKCHSLSDLAIDPSVPVQYNSALREYYLIAKNKKRIFFYYCPICGGRLPKSRREQYFTKPSAREITKINGKIKNAKSFDAILSVLGEPEEKYGPMLHNTKHLKKRKTKNVKRTVRYTSLAKTFNLLLQEYEDGKFIVIFERKLKPGVDYKGLNL